MSPLTRNKRAFLPPSSAAFTLLELLVVVSIIGTLLGILLPAIGAAREQARGAQCLARCRELAHGMMFYHEDHDNYPAHQWRLPNGERLRWFNAMAEYLGGYQVQSCPSVPDWAIGRNNSYGYNYKYLGSVRDNVSDLNPRPPFEAFPIKNLRLPVRTIAFGDCDGTGWKLSWGPEGGDHHPDRLGNHGYLLDPTYIPLHSLESYSGGALEPYAWRLYRAYLSDRHLGKSVVVFADGHGERIDPRVAYEDNALWNGLGLDPGYDPNHPLYHLDRHVDYKLHPGSGQEWRY